ncbi:hypothetical protein DMUE_0212 [Dictyocoela muelleri]|nr:hypothetical protein DMUE_0212 [Dictyocoela muelleri]
MELCESLSGKNRKLFMDNYYNSANFSKKLIEKNIYYRDFKIKRGGSKNLASLKKQSIVEEKIVLENESLHLLIWFYRRSVVVFKNCYDCNEVVYGKKKKY